MENKKILIYGANGYTAKLFAKHLLDQGIRPILAGRSKEVKEIADKLGCESRIFPVEEAKNNLEDIDAIVNLAGPFNVTQKPLIEACLKTKTHYLDIAGEVEEIESAKQYDEKAKQAEIILLPAAGFGVVPTDIAAKIASSLIENPNNLTIIYATKGSASKGTLKTILQDIQKEGVAVKDGKFVPAKPAEKEVKTHILEHKVKAVYNPWRADLSTAQISTNIPNIRTYSEFPGIVVWMMKGRLNWLRSLILNNFLKYFPDGPNEKKRKSGKTHIQAVVRNDHGKHANVEIRGPEAYVFTILCLERMLGCVLRSKESGFKTPSAFGTSWLSRLEEVELKENIIK